MLLHYRALSSWANRSASAGCRAWCAGWHFPSTRKPSDPWGTCVTARPWLASAQHPYPKSTWKHTTLRPNTSHTSTVQHLSSRHRRSRRRQPPRPILRASVEPPSSFAITSCQKTSIGCWPRVATTAASYWRLSSSTSTSRTRRDEREPRRGGSGWRSWWTGSSEWWLWPLFPGDSSLEGSDALDTENWGVRSNQ